VGGGPERSTSLRELTTLCATLTGREIDVEPAPETHPADIPWFVTDLEGIGAASGWMPRRSLEATVGEVIAWIEAHRDSLAPILGSA